MEPMNTTESPAVARHRLRLALRRARDHTGLTQQQVADALSWSLSKVNRIESGDVTISITDLRALLSLLEVSDAATVERLTADARTARRRGWWDDPTVREHLTPGTIQLLQFEAEATELRYFQPAIVPGVLQTREYAEAILDYRDDLDPPTRMARLDTRMKRAAQAFERQDLAPHYLFVLDESVLNRIVGGPRVLADQLQHLTELCDRPNVLIRIVPLADSVMAIMGSFILLDLDENDIVLYRESGFEDDIVHASAIVDRYRAKFEVLWDQSLDPAASKRLIQARAAELLSLLDRRPLWPNDAATEVDRRSA
jgi:transcriptional regulator with XRE-family HTH domain